MKYLLLRNEGFKHHNIGQGALIFSFAATAAGAANVAIETWMFLIQALINASSRDTIPTGLKTIAFGFAEPKSRYLKTLIDLGRDMFDTTHRHLAQLNVLRLRCICFRGAGVRCMVISMDTQRYQR